MSGGAVWMLALLACGGRAPELMPGLELSLVGGWTHQGRTVVVPDARARGPVTLSRTLVMPASWRATDAAVLHVDGAGWLVIASLEGQEVGRASGGLWPLAMDLTGSLRSGAQELTLQFVGPSVDNVWPGHRVQSLDSWTSGRPEAGSTRRRGSVWLELPGTAPLGKPVVSTKKDQVTVAVEAPGRDGETLTLDVVRDGKSLLRRQSVRVRGGAAAFVFSWSGPRWQLGGSDEPFLQQAVVTAQDGTSRQVRFGVRDIQREGRQLVLDGEPFYLAGQRFVPLQGSSRDDMARFGSLIERMGGNAADIHGELHEDELLQAADELGLAVVLEPRCAGPGRTDRAVSGPEREALERLFLDGNAQLAQARQHHPSLLVWSEEAVDVEGFMEAFSGTGIPVVLGTEGWGMGEDSRVNGLPKSLPPTFINEMPWNVGSVDGRGIAERLRAPLLSHVRWGLGAVLPHMNRHPRVGRPEAFEVTTRLGEVKLLLDELAVPQFRFGDRRGPAQLVVSVQDAAGPVVGVPVLLEVPLQPVMGAFTDVQGQAHLSLDYAGTAEVRLVGDSESVQVALESGRYSGGSWTPSIAQVTLTR